MFYRVFKLFYFAPTVSCLGDMAVDWLVSGGAFGTEAHDLYAEAPGGAVAHLREGIERCRNTLLGILAQLVCKGVDLIKRC